MNNDDDLLKAFKPRFIKYLQLVGPLKNGRLPKGGNYEVYKRGDNKETPAIKISWCSPLLEKYAYKGKPLTNMHAMVISITLDELSRDTIFDEYMDIGVIILYTNRSIYHMLN